MTKEVAQLLKECNITDKKVLDIGSRDFNGSLKDSLVNCEYVGLDQVHGENVDVVASSYQLPFSDRSFDVVACLHMLGHDKLFWLTIDEIYRVVTDNGLIILTAPKFGFPECLACTDYYRFSKTAFLRLFDRCYNIKIHETEQSWVGFGVRNYAKMSS